MAARRALVLVAGAPAELPAADTLVGAGDPWTRRKLASDFTTALATFGNITDGVTPFSFTPPANSDFVIEAELLIWTTSAANLPRIGVAIAAGQVYGAVAMQQTGATATARVMADGTFLTGAVNVQMAAGGLPAANTPYLVQVTVKGRAGASPGAIALQLACETAAANVCFVKAGSEMRSRTI